MTHTSDHPDFSAEQRDSITQIISEFSALLAYSRSRWASYAEEAHPDLKGGGLMMLQVIFRKGSVTATGLSHMLGSDKAMVSRQITKLRELGFVAAEPSAEDRRVVLLSVTDEGAELLEQVRRRWAHSYHERFESWSLDDLEALRSGLHRFNVAQDAAQEGALDGPAARCRREHVAAGQGAGGPGASKPGAAAPGTHAE